jgi:hypothetical protein
VLTTNPEFLVVVEAQSVDGKSRWVYSPERFTGRQCELQIQNQQVWPPGDQPTAHDLAAPFFQLRKFGAVDGVIKTSQENLELHKLVE